MVGKNGSVKQGSTHWHTGTVVMSPVEPRARQDPSHRPAKNTAFSSCGASYTASIFSGSSGQNVATSRGPMGLFCGVTVRQMNLKGGRGHQKPHLQSPCSCNHTCLPKSIQRQPAITPGRGEARSKEGWRRTVEWTQAPLPAAKLGSDLFAPPLAPLSGKPS